MICQLSFRSSSGSTSSGDSATQPLPDSPEGSTSQDLRQESPSTNPHLSTPDAHESPSPDAPEGSTSYDLLHASSSSDQRADNSPSDFVSDLIRWSLKHNISHSALSDLCSFTRNYFPHLGLPTDARTLLNTCRSTTEIVPIGNGQFIYYGFDQVLPLLKDDNLTDYSLSLNFDGLPLFKSSNTSFWPILGRFAHNPAVFVLGCFCGSGKPSLDDYLQPLIEDLQRFHLGVEFQGRCVKIKLDLVSMDTPAKAYIKCIKSFNGYFGCDQCTQKGRWCNRVVFCDASFEKRTDYSFRQKIQDEHHHGTTPFTHLPYIDMINHFPIDYMHVVCLGATRKLLMLFLRGPLPIRKPAAVVEEMNSTICDLSQFVSSDFLRCGRSLREIDCWKAAEFRLFILYTGMLIFYEPLNYIQYEHFLKFVCAMRILAADSTSADDIEVARHLIVSFVTHFKELYGVENLVFVVHCLLHLPDNVLVHGRLDNFSCFSFESFLGRLKRILRSGARPLSQLSKRISEFGPTLSIDRKVLQGCEMTLSKESSHSIRVSNNELSFQVEKTYDMLTLHSFSLRIGERDSCFMTDDNNIFRVCAFVRLKNKSLYAVCQRFQGVTDLFCSPVRSSSVGVFQASSLGPKIFVAAIDIKSKLLCFPHKDKYLLQTLVHTDK